MCVRDENIDLCRDQDATDVLHGLTGTHRFEVSVNDGWLHGMEIFKAFGDVEYLERLECMLYLYMISAYQ